jgi:hypothetical protein
VRPVLACKYLLANLALCKQILARVHALFFLVPITVNIPFRRDALKIGWRFSFSAGYWISANFQAVFRKF